MSKVIDNIEDIASIDSKAVLTTTQTALDLKAPLASPALTGTPTLNGEGLVKLSSDGLRIEKANDSSIKNQCTAWVNFDGTTTPPTIRDSYNVSSVVRTYTGAYDVYFTAPMDNANYSISTAEDSDLDYGSQSAINYTESTINKFRFHSYNGSNAYENVKYLSA